MEVTGKVKTVLEQQTFGSGFTKREVVVTTDEQYPQHLLIEFVQDKVALLSDLSVDDKVKISINLRGREWQAPDGTIKYFNSIQGWRLEKLGDSPSGIQDTPPPYEQFGGKDLAPPNEEMDDLPF
ncbi:uncharacterized protein DUF3127 [Balneicella halophila]|uniref:Uncharacterized protein DUF3127 n=1 Tax=Balneicella halophila TaxID=1537566 RepID=A0A7L4UMN3_BALHA|nr:DUF3127 domain-containing protein [Balneicella halophila]PVX49884.1 uncharacterized protein DUF3127 [Balneicella halophila]